ncbi:MAG TPA: AraC family transcriptional regulator [Planctomycetota bacterium]|nr:AraC family transcriptional regulator [Planctomycetota bacterium]
MTADNHASGPVVRNAWPPRSGLPTLLAAVCGRWTHAGLSGRIVHPCWVLDYCFEPAGICRVGRPARAWKERPARVGHLYPPGCPYWEDTRSVRRRLHGAYITFLGGEAAGLGALVANRCGYARILDPEDLLGARLRQTAEAGQAGGEAGFWPAQAGLYALIGLLLGAERTGEEVWRLGGAAGAPAEPSLGMSVRAYLEEHLTEPVALAEIAEHLGVSVSSLSHRYKTETGETPMAARSRLALNAARALLLKGAALKQIAAETGFCDVYHLSKAFKRAEGLSPRAWLKSLAGGLRPSPP